MANKVTNISASVRARLLNRARSEQRPFNELLQYYSMERFLYRLSKSKHADSFVLKGGLMLQMWGGSLKRATKDIDLHRAASASVNELEIIIRDCIGVQVEDDGSVLAKAVDATFSRRKTPLPMEGPIALTPAFTDAREKSTQWTSYAKKARVRGDVPSLGEATELINDFLMPVVEALVAEKLFDAEWSPGPHS